ncbi:MAG: hypothetical protein HY700_17055 [Gemmatimonadetes bacterium]|nr:hypothetical protein [Gemmatimonadota bacterium]
MRGRTIRAHAPAAALPLDVAMQTPMTLFVSSQNHAPLARAWRRATISEHPRRIVRFPAILFATLVLTACGPAPGRRSEPDRQNASVDSVAQYLIATAAADFYAHRPPDPVRFRDVRIGHVMAPGGKEQYLLCGQFLPAQQGGKAEWTPFATIKTSGYEQWIGAQAVGFCQSSALKWDQVGDLSSSLQSRLDSLR